MIVLISEGRVLFSAREASIRNAILSTAFVIIEMNFACWPVCCAPTSS
jgi:hypothetical protein